MLALDLLRHELDAWGDQGLVAGFWWRDDDLGSPTPALDPLLRTATALEMEPLLAVVPTWATPDLPRRLAGEPARVAVHGWAHVNHEAGPLKKAEFGGARPLADLLADAVNGLDRLTDMFGDGLVPCFIPPWNRVAPELAGALAATGFQALSTFGDRPRDGNGNDVDWINTHVDVIDWRGDRRFAGPDVMARDITSRLVQRRHGETSSSEPIGLLSHHLEMVCEDWRGFENVCVILVTHPAARMLTSRDLFKRRREP